MSVALRKRLLNAVLPDGGWGYYAGQSSRIEPTAWATLALTADGDRLTTAARRAALTALWTPLQKANGLIVEAQSGVSNAAFNGLALLALGATGEPATSPLTTRIADGLLAVKGIQLKDAGTAIRQDTLIQAWSWTDGTFSWAEPTAWCLVALKIARRTTGAAATRIRDGERMLVDRVCQSGGWNYGNSNAFAQDLRPYVPTTALGLIALQDRRAEPAVVKSLAWLEAHSLSERSAMALSLAAIALSVYDRPIDRLVTALNEQEGKTASLENAHLMAMTLYALTISTHKARAFRI